MKVLSLPQKAHKTKTIAPTPEDSAQELWQKFSQTLENDDQEEFWKGYETLISASKTIQAKEASTELNGQVYSFSIRQSLQKKRWKKIRQEQMDKGLITFLRAMFICNFPAFFLNAFGVAVFISLGLITYFLIKLSVNLYTELSLLKAVYEVSPTGVVQYEKGQVATNLLHRDIVGIELIPSGIRLFKKQIPGQAQVAMNIPYDVDDFHQIEKLLLHYTKTLN